MPRDISDLLSAALALPADQRGQLITALIDSLDSEEEMSSPSEVEAAWKAEVERREAELDVNPTSARACYLTKWGNLCYAADNSTRSPYTSAEGDRNNDLNFELEGNVSWGNQELKDWDVLTFLPAVSGG